MGCSFEIEDDVELVNLNAILLKSRSNVLENCEVRWGQLVCSYDVHQRFGLSVSTHAVEAIELGLSAQFRWMKLVYSITNNCVKMSPCCQSQRCSSIEHVQLIVPDLEKDFVVNPLNFYKIFQLFERRIPWIDWEHHWTRLVHRTGCLKLAR